MIKILLLLLLALGPVQAFAEEGVKIKLTPEGIERGSALFTQYCSGCHGLKFYKGGVQPAIDAQAAEAAFGVAPPDLSLMASARGRGDEGAEYIYRLLTSYYIVDGQTRNKAFAEETKTDGAIAMPPPIPIDDPALREKAADISAFLLSVSDPTAEERLSIGPWVLSYMALLTAILYLLNRYTWKGVKKKLNS